MEYLIILAIVLIITVILEKTHHIHLYKNRKERLEIVGLFFIMGVIWDWYAIYRGHWVYPRTSNSGIFLGIMPLEDYLFMLVLPYYILTVYKVMDSKFRSKKSR